MLLKQGVDTRREDSSLLFEDFVKRVVRKLAQVIQQTAKKTEVQLSQEEFESVQKSNGGRLSKIVGDGASIILPWLSLSSEDIKGEYDFDIEVGSTRPINQETRKRDASTIYQMLAGNPFVNIYEGTKEVLQAFDFKDVDRLLKKPEQVAQEQDESEKKQLESQVAVDMPKRQTDLQKTVLKTESAEKQTDVKGRVTLLTAALKKSAGGE